MADITLEAIGKLLDSRLEPIQKQLQETQEETRKLSQQMASFENNMQKKVELVLEGQTDNNRQIQDLREDVAILKQTLSEGVVVKTIGIA